MATPLPTSLTVTSKGQVTLPAQAVAREDATCASSLSHPFSSMA